MRELLGVIVNDYCGTDCFSVFIQRVINVNEDSEQKLCVKSVNRLMCVVIVTFLLALLLTLPLGMISVGKLYVSHAKFCTAAYNYSYCLSKTAL